ncbi:hypothetical protein LIER_15633 [Lithospermum erythrorhizon]|uniref:Uncharacterized protein n=1 Tax=Lithospermum erythrorhizon TaxID=34254 RepID=A0AAV3Q692_LITER
MAIFRDINKVLFGLMEICILFFLSEGGETFKIPPTCASYKCPKFKVVDNVKDIEIRTYDQSYWITSPFIPSSTFKPAGDQAFLMLYNYTNGSNDRGAILNLTAPILVETSYQLSKSKSKSLALPSYKLYFYVDPRFQKNPPSPLQKDLQLVQLPKFAVAKRFVELVDEKSINAEISALKGSLNGTRWETPARGGRSTVASYTEPEEAANRISEAIIWFKN